jgi:1-acyl-sn-glycerol-3-phosphate acyltransferase
MNTQDNFKKQIPEPPKNIKVFNTRRKPKRRKFVPWVAQTVISWPDLKKRGAKLTRTNMEPLDGKPYLLLINHASKVDLNMMYKATHPHPLVNVMTIEGFRDFTLPLMDLLGVIGKRKFIQDLNLIKNIKYTIKELGAIFVLFPESRYSLDGTTSYITPSVGALVHMIKVPVAVLTLHGNFVTHPQWNKKNKHTYVEGEIRPIVLPEEADSVSADEVNRRIAEAFKYDDYAWQYENKVKIDEPFRADGLNRILFKCASCHTEGSMEGKGTKLKCRECGKEYELDEYGRLNALDGNTEFAHIPDWYNWERRCVRDEVVSGNYKLDVNVEICALVDYKGLYKIGEGRLVHDREGFCLTGCDGRLEYRQKPLVSHSVNADYFWYELGDVISIGNRDTLYYCFPKEKGDFVAKTRMAAEEMYKLVRPKKQ